MMTFNNSRGKKAFGYQPRHLKDKHKSQQEKLEEINAKEEEIKNQKNEIFNEEQKLKNEILLQNELLEKELNKKVQTHEVELESKKNIINKQKEELVFAEEKLRFEQTRYKEISTNSSNGTSDISQKELELRKKEEELIALRNKLTTEEKILEKFKEEKIKAALLEQERKEAELKQKEIELKEKELLLLQKKENVLKEEALLIEEKEKHTESIELENIELLKTTLNKKDNVSNSETISSESISNNNDTSKDNVDNLRYNKSNTLINDKIYSDIDKVNHNSNSNTEISKQINSDIQKLNVIKKENSKLEELKQKALSMLQDEEDRFIALKKEQEEKLRLEKERIENELRIQQEEFKKKEAELQNILKNLDKTKLKLKEEKEKQNNFINDNLALQQKKEIIVSEEMIKKDVLSKDNLPIVESKDNSTKIVTPLVDTLFEKEIQNQSKSKSIIEEAKSFENSEFFSPDEKLTTSNENILKTINHINAPIDSSKLTDVKKETEEIEFSKSKFFEKQANVNLDQASSLCEIFYEGEVAILQLNYKRLTFNKAAEFKKLIDGVIETNNKIILVLNNTQFLDSTVLGVLICSLKKLKQVGGSMKIVSDDNIKSNIFLVSGMEKIFDIHQNVETALASIAS